MKAPGEAIYSATQICRKSLSDCIQSEELMQNEWAETRLADFNLWASGLGASVQGRASLDARLASRPDARDAVTNLLQMLVGAVKDCKALVRGSAESISAGCDEDHPTSDSEEDPPRSFSPWSDDSDSDTDLELTLNDSQLHKAKETVNSLLDLLVRIAITIRRSGTQSRLRKADQKFKIQDHEELQRHLVIIMLSQGPFSSGHTCSPDQTDLSKLTAIQWRLLNCNLKRRNRFLYAQRHSEALDTPSSGTNPSTETPKREVQDLPARPIDSVPLQRPSAKSVAMATSASGITDLPATLPTLPKGPASSHATRTHLSTTVTKLPYPRPPKVGNDAMVFKCPCCCQTLPVGILETSRWKKHLAEDIQPYTCVLSGCSSPEVLYVTKKEWELHLRGDHGSTDMWTCFACLDSLQFEAEADFVAHTVREHGETISQGQIHALAAACKTSITAEITSCPLCAWPTLEESEVSQIAVLDHIAEHVHAFSLRALPWAPDAVHETEAAVQKAATKVEPWLTKHNLTSETLTVIDTSITTLAPSSPPPHYFDTYEYFAEDSDNSSCSTVSDGTIERELREEPPLLFEDLDNEDDVAGPDDEATESEEDEEDLNGHKNSAFSLLDAFDDLWREHIGAELHKNGITDDFIKENQEFIIDYIKEEQRKAPRPDSTPPPDNEDDVAEPNDEAGGSEEDEEDSDSDYFMGEDVNKWSGELETESSGYISRLSLWYTRQDASLTKRSNYKFGRIIRSGKNSAVCEAQSGDGKVAIKSMIKKTVKDRAREIYQEIELLQYVKHPNIVRFVDWFETRVNYYIVTDLAYGGELFERVTDQGKISEPDAQRTVRDILAAVEYLHDHGIVHRHLDVHKFCYVTRAESSRLILVSLAHGDWEKSEERYIIPVEPDRPSTRASAPEIMRRERSGKPADMWSIGVITYMILAGYSPFRSEDIHDLIEECTGGSIVFHERYWKNTSDEAKDFIRRCLEPNPEDRLTMEEALRHPWTAVIRGRRSRLMRARWRCAILKVQLPLQIQQLRKPLDDPNEDDKQDVPGANEDITEYHSFDPRYKRQLSALQKRIPRGLSISEIEDYLRRYRDRCQKLFRTAGLILMAVKEVQYLTHLSYEARQTVK